VASLSEATLSVDSASFENDQLDGKALVVVSGNARGWQTIVATNTSTGVTASDPFPDTLSAGDSVVIADASWRLAGRSYSDQITWEVPNRAGLAIQINAGQARQVAWKLQSSSHIYTDTRSREELGAS